MYIHTHIHVHIYKHTPNTNTHKHTHTLIYAYIHTHAFTHTTHTHTHTHKHIRTHARTYTHALSIWSHIHTKFTSVHTRILVHIHTYIHTNTKPQYVSLMETACFVSNFKTFAHTLTACKKEMLEEIEVTTAMHEHHILRIEQAVHNRISNIHSLHLYWEGSQQFQSHSLPARKYRRLKEHMIAKGAYSNS
jgi:hypothetical protein